MNVEMPDGTVIEGVPEGTPKDAIWAKYQASIGGAEPMPSEGPGFFERSKDTLTQGVSDIMSTAMGENYQDDAEPLYQSPAEATQTAVSQGIGAAGGVAGDAVMSAGKAILPQGAQDAIESGFNAVMQSAPAQAIGEAVTAGSEAIGPDASRRVGELANIATVGLPKAKIPGKGSQRVLAKKAKVLRDSQEAKTKGRRKDKVEAMLEPEDGYGRGETELNAAGTSVYTPTPDEQLVVDAVTDLKGIRPKRSTRFNEAVVAKEARKEVEAVNARINRAGNPEVDVGKLNTEISDAFNDVDKLGFPMTGDVRTAAERLVEKARRLIEESDGTANGVLQARRDFDSWAKLNKPQVFSETNESAMGIAGRVVRATMNDHIDALVPSAKVKPSLEKTHLLLKAKADLRKKAAKTAKTKVGRVLQKMQGHLPTTPLAQWSTLGAGWAVATQPWVASLFLLAGGTYAGAKALQYGTREWRGTLSRVISGMEKTLKAGEAPAKVLADIRADKLALVEMLKDERENEDDE